MHGSALAWPGWSAPLPGQAWELPWRRPPRPLGLANS